MNSIINHASEFNEQSPSESLASQGDKSNFLQAKFTELIDGCPSRTLDEAFYFEYCKLYISTLKLQQQVTKAQHEVEHLRSLFSSSPPKRRKLSASNCNPQNTNQEKKKRMRRTANEIARHYVCKVEDCQKSYGSEGSLNQHIKLKHKELYESGEFRNLH